MIYIIQLTQSPDIEPNAYWYKVFHRVKNDINAVIIAVIMTNSILSLFTSQKFDSCLLFNSILVFELGLSSLKIKMKHQNVIKYSHILILKSFSKINA